MGLATETPDAKLIRRSVAYPECFVAIFERHHPALFRYLLRRVGESLADELAGEVFARAFARRDRYRADWESALPWLYGIANKLVAEHRRAERRRLRSLERLASTATSSTEVADGGQPPVSRDLVHALRRLPAGERDALLLVAWGELSYDETAEALGVPVGTVRSRISRARHRLQAANPVQLATTISGEAHA